MNLDWTKIKQKYDEIVNSNGVLIQWLQRITSGSTAYVTGSTDTYGYGDEITYWITGSCKAVVEHVSVKDIVIEPGFFEEDYDRIYVNADSNIAYWDQIIYPSGSGVRYLVLPLHVWRAGSAGTIVSISTIIRRLVPRDKTSY